MSEITFPLEFSVEGTPVSLQAGNKKAKNEWMTRIRDEASNFLPEMHFAAENDISITIFHFPANDLACDLDNILKFIIDSLSAHVFVDDRQVERIFIQKFPSSKVIEFNDPSLALVNAISSQRPVTFIRIHDDPTGDNHAYVS